MTATDMPLPTPRERSPFARPARSAQGRGGFVGAPPRTAIAVGFSDAGDYAEWFVGASPRTAIDMKSPTALVRGPRPRSCARDASAR